MSSGFGKLASMPAGGAAPVATSAAPGSGGAAAPAAGERSSLAPIFQHHSHLGRRAFAFTMRIVIIKKSFYMLQVEIGLLSDHYMLFNCS